MLGPLPLAGQCLRFLQIVRGQHDRRPLVAQVAYQLPCATPGTGVEARRRLVQEQQARRVQDAERQVQAALLASGQVLYAGVGIQWRRVTLGVRRKGECHPQATPLCPRRRA